MGSAGTTGGSGFAMRGGLTGAAGFMGSAIFGGLSGSGIFGTDGSATLGREARVGSLG